ncbi:MAG: hypothetical protein DMG36_10520 [Acidobacteria bacterium]|nr:MAG: hypothetical protein DMG36_10520 [Acidobacteriota bacterium]
MLPNYVDMGERAGQPPPLHNQSQKDRERRAAAVLRPYKRFVVLDESDHHAAELGGLFENT